MHHFIFILISFLSGVSCGTTVSTKADLLAVIRQDLRRNNDDYVESTISLPTLLSPKPLKPSTTTQIPPVSNKNEKTTINVKSSNSFKTTDQKTTMNIKTTKKASPFRRVFISSEVLIDDRPKHRPIKIDPSQFLITIRKMSGKSKKQTRFTRTYKTDEMGRKNGLYQPDRKIYRQKTNPSTIREKSKAAETDEELVKIQALMNELDENDEEEPEATPNPRTDQTSKLELKTRTKMKTMISKAVKPQRLGLVMSKIHDPPMVTPLREKMPITLNEPSIEEVQAPWEIPRIETTRGAIHRVGLKSRDAETPAWRAVESKETNKPINQLQIVTKVNKNKAQLLKRKAGLTLNEPSIEEVQAPREIPRLETTRGVIHRMGLKSRDAETEIQRAVEFKETNMLLVVTKINKNKAQAVKPKAEGVKLKAEAIKPKAENMVRMETKLRQKNNYDLDRINELKVKLREGLKLSSLPPGDLLDLWPARGPMVNALRLKNRLCQRSVLLNEGPKYDSKGSTYMPRFKPRLYGKKKIIDFHQTKSPILVLPRCCNCCRKSVLGCE